MNEFIDFRLEQRALLDVAKQFDIRLREGLSAENQEIKALPTYVALGGQRNTDHAYVLDLGGSNLRAAFVDLGTGSVSDPIVRSMPWQRGIAMEKSDYLSVQAELLQQLPQRASAPLGYCFSYPASSEHNGDARLLRWTKGVVVPDTEGQLVGAELLQCMKTRFGRRFPALAVINDTVASMLAGFDRGGCDAYAGLIVGTGMNLAGLMRAREIPKLPLAFRDSALQFPVNFESGNFHPPGLAEWDDIVDKKSENPGRQRFEKAVSGMYLGRIFSAAYPELEFDPESGARGLLEFACSSAEEGLARSASSLYERSAQLVAAQLAGLALFYSRRKDCATLRIVVEGGLAWSSINSNIHYIDLLKRNLLALLRSLDVGISAELVQITNANLIGAAVAASSLS